MVKVVFKGILMSRDVSGEAATGPRLNAAHATNPTVIETTTVFAAIFGKQFAFGDASKSAPDASGRPLKHDPQDAELPALTRERSTQFLAKSAILGFRAKVRGVASVRMCPENWHWC